MRTTLAISSSLPLALAMILLLAPMGRAETAQPWSGKINGYDAYVPDLNKPIRAAAINGGVAWLSDSNPDWRAVAIAFNCIQLALPLDYERPDASAERIITTLTMASAALPGHPEIQYAPVALFGFSAGAAAASITASSPLLSNPDPAKAPQRVLAVVGLDEISRPPFLPPLSTPHLVLSDPGDKYSGLLTDVEELEPAITHDAYARRRASVEGAPLTLISQPGHWHGGSVHGINNEVDYRFARVWLEEVFRQRLPAEPPVGAPVALPDWNNHSGWLGTYDVATEPDAPPWGNAERMTRVAIFPRAAYRDPRPFIWLPSEYCAKVWQIYASTGSMPSLAPERPTIPLNAFSRTYRARIFDVIAHVIGERRLKRRFASFGDQLAVSRDEPMRIVAGPKPAPGPAAKRCRLSSDLTVIATFDRAIVSADVAVASGSGVLRGAPVFWSNTITIALKDVADAPALQIHLTNITPQDGGPATEATITPLCP
jgi:hypothetical protein